MSLPDTALDLLTERALIAAAQNGDETASAKLLDAYSPAARLAARRFSSTVEDEDAAQAAALGILSAIAAFDPSRWERLSAIVSDHIRAELTTAASDAGHVQIPSRTLTRYWGIMREAEGDWNKGCAVAETHGMSRETFSAVHTAVTREELPTGHAEPWDNFDAFAAAEDRLMAAQALAAMDQSQSRVTRLAYGFDGYRPLSDGEVADELGMSRPTVQRHRVAGLNAARISLGIA